MPKCSTRPLTNDNPGNCVGFDVVEQEVLWRFQTGSGIIGSPITRDEMWQVHAFLMSRDGL